MTRRLVRVLLLALAIVLLGAAPAATEWRSPSLGTPWHPRLWAPAPMEYPVRLYILDQARFARAARLYGLAPSIAAFAVWRPRLLCWIFTTPRGLSALRHELRHCQQDYFHRQGDSP